MQDVHRAANDLIGVVEHRKLLVRPEADFENTAPVFPTEAMFVALAMLTTDPAERRLQRLATPTHEDNRISWGCINVPVAFYEAHVRPAFASRRAAIYVLPEVLSLAEVFGHPAAGNAPALPDTLARASMPHDIQP